MKYRQVRGRAASVSPKSRPKVHLPAQSAPRLRRNPPTAARTAGKTHRCLNGGRVPESVKAGAAIGFLIAASVFSHRLPSLRTHAPCHRFSGSKDCTAMVSLLSIPLGLSRDKIWREKLFLGLVQIEINLCTLLSICTKPRKSFSRQIFSRDKPSGIDNSHQLLSFFMYW